MTQPPSKPQPDPQHAPQSGMPAATVEAVWVSVLLIRHGETEWNAAGRIQGHIDTPLSAHGVWQAERLAVALEAVPVGAILASDLQRAAQTAGPLAKAKGLRIGFDPRLRERNFGVFEGLTRAEIETRYPAAFEQWMTRDPAFAPDRGESTLQFAERVSAALRSAAELATKLAGSVVVVAHGGVLDVAYRLAQGLSWQAQRQHPLLNASINRLAAQASSPGLALKFRVDSWGDVAHLAESDDDVLA